MPGLIAWLAGEDGSQPWLQFQQQGQSWPDFSWRFYASWCEFQAEKDSVEALVLPLWITLSPGIYVDCLQVVDLLQPRPMVVLLNDAQREHSWRLQQEGLETLERQSWKSAWPELSEKLRARLAVSRLENPLANYQELLIQQDQEIRFQVGCQDCEARGDMLAFIQMKGKALGQLLDWGESQRVQMLTGSRGSLFVFSGSSALYAGTGSEQGAHNLGWPEFERVRAEGFQL